MTRVNYKHSEETKRKIGLANSIALKGKKHTEESKRKISEANTGERNASWKGGISNLEVRAGRKKPERCELCHKKSVKICFDHNHTTGRFRGWICTKCNVTLGMVDDNIQQLEVLKQYLKKDGVLFDQEEQYAMYEEALCNSKLIKLSE